MKPAKVKYVYPPVWYSRVTACYGGRQRRFGFGFELWPRPWIGLHVGRRVFRWPGITPWGWSVSSPLPATARK